MLPAHRCRLRQNDAVRREVQAWWRLETFVMGRHLAQHLALGRVGL
jgi:hypothetical protein